MKLKRRLLALTAGLFAVMALLFHQGDVNAASLSSQVQLVVKATLTDTADLVTAEAPLVFQQLLTMANGDAANQASVVWSDTRTLAASGTEDLDLAGGGLTDPFGVAFAPAKIRALIVSAASTNTNNVVVGNKAAQVPYLGAVTESVAILPGGMVVLTAPALAGIPVTATTGDLITVTNSAGGTGVTYSIIILGTAT